MDIEMPGMDGFETAACIRADSAERHVPIPFFTAHTRIGPTTCSTMRGSGIPSVPRSGDSTPHVRTTRAPAYPARS